MDRKAELRDLREEHTKSLKAVVAELDKMEPISEDEIFGVDGSQEDQ